jgi:hypothetical protein
MTNLFLESKRPKNLRRRKCRQPEAARVASRLDNKYHDLKKLRKTLGLKNRPQKDFNGSNSLTAKSKTLMRAFDLTSSPGDEALTRLPLIDA